MPVRVPPAGRPWPLARRRWPGAPHRTRRRKAKTHLEIWSWAVGLCVIGIVALTAEHGGTLRTGCVVFILASVGAFQSYDLSRRRSAADGRLGGLNATRE